MIRRQKPYEPVAGTIPHKVIQHLESLPPGTKLTTGQLIEALGQTHVTNLSSVLIPPVKAGWIKREPKPYSNQVLWSLGDRTPINQQPTDPDDDTSDLAGPMPTPNLAAASVFTLAKPAATTAPTPTTAAQPSPAPDFRCALYNDGQLYIKSNGTEHTLPTDHTRLLVHYLESMSAGDFHA